MPKGTVILVPFPFTDLSGHKVRPAVVLHHNQKSEDCVVAFLSSARQKKMLPFDVAATPSKQNGLKVDSIVKVNKIATLQKNILLGELGTLEADIIARVNIKLKHIFQI